MRPRTRRTADDFAAWALRGRSAESPKASRNWNLVLGFVAAALQVQSALAAPPEPTDPRRVARETLNQLKQEHRYEPTASREPAPPPPDPTAAIILLPKMTIVAPKAATLDEKDTLSGPGLETELRKRYAGASFRGQAATGSRLPNYAALMWEDDQRLERQQDLGDFADLLMQTGDVKGAEQLKSNLSGTFIRQSDAKTDAMETSVNNGRR